MKGRKQSITISNETEDTISGQELALRYLLSFTMGLDIVHPKSVTRLHPLRQALFNQTKLEQKNSLFGTGSSHNSPRTSRAGRFQRSMSVSYSESQFESETSVASSSVGESEDTEHDSSIAQSQSEISTEDAQLTDTKKKKKKKNKRFRFGRSRKKSISESVDEQDTSATDEDWDASSELSFDPTDTRTPTTGGKSTLSASTYSLKNISLQGRNKPRSASFSVPKMKKANSMSSILGEHPQSSAMTEKLKSIEHANSMLNNVDECELSKRILIMALVNPKKRQRKALSISPKHNKCATVPDCTYRQW